MRKQSASQEPEESAVVDENVESRGIAQSEGENSVKSVRFSPLPELGGRGESSGIDLLMDVDLSLTVELGRTSIPVREVLQLGLGSVVELDKLAGEPVDIMLNGRLIAKGEAVVVDENFGVRVTEIISKKDRLDSAA